MCFITSRTYPVGSVFDRREKSGPFRHQNTADKAVFSNFHAGGRFGHAMGNKYHAGRKIQAIPQGTAQPARL